MAKFESEDKYPFGPYQKELDETIDKIKEAWKNFSNEPVNYDKMPDEYFYGIFGNLGIVRED